MAKENAAEAKNAPKTPDVAKKESDTKVKKSEQKPKDSKPKVNVIQKVTRFFKELKSEFKKIVWPGKKTVINNTLVVLAVVLVLGIGIWLLDILFIWGFGLLF